MTRVEYAREDGKFSLLCLGHAGYADVGNDIVCAAISTLVQTLVAYKDDLDFKIQAGSFWAYGDASEADALIITGLELIESAYPQYIEVIKGCPTISKNPLT